jgi:nucleotide sugar dehydrogenase
MGLPLAAQFASHGWSVIAVDVNEAVVAALNEGRAHVTEEPDLAERVAAAHAAGRLRATTEGAAAARESDVVVLIVPVMLDDEQHPDYRHMDAAADAIAPGVRAGTTVIFETTLPVGDTRSRYAPRLEAASGLVADRDFFVAFSPERLFTGAVFRNLATYPKLVGGIGPASTERAARFYASVLDAEVVAMSTAEAAELSKLADTTYRDLNIAFANELARYADRIGVDVLEVIRAANSQPYSHIHQPGLGVGGHCIPVYPHFLLSRAPEMELVEVARRVNDGQVDVAIEQLRAELGSLEGVSVLVLGLTYREGVKELAYSRALPLIERLASAGARVSAWDPLLAPEEVELCGAALWAWGTPSDARAIVLQTADPTFRGLDPAWFADLEVLLDGRNGLPDVAYPEGVRILGMGVPPRGRASMTSGPAASGAGR